MGAKGSKGAGGVKGSSSFSPFGTFVSFGSFGTLYIMIKIGDRLKEERKKQGLAIDEVARSTKIRPQFISAIETGDYRRLPGSSYTQGFVKNYIEFLGLPMKESMAMFRREYNEIEYTKVMPDSFVGREDIPLKTFRLNRAIGLVLVIVIGILFYLFYQYRSAFFAPSLSVDSPPERAKISSQTVAVSGITDTNTTVTVNDLPTLVDSTGHFIKEIPVFPGTTTITIKSENSFGKISTVERHVIVAVGQ
ncbi:MAG TPA: helix-turn-helix domain-containing protein [Patescibacteria group bacterium]